MNQFNFKISSLTGTRYSAHGNSKNWSTWHSKEEFSLKQHCFIHQYDMFKDDKYQVREYYSKILRLINLHYIKIVVKREIILNFPQHFLILIVSDSPAALPHLYGIFQNKTLVLCSLYKYFALLFRCKCYWTQTNKNY